LSSNNAFQRAEELKTTTRPLKDQIKIIESLDKLLGKASGIGDKKCKHCQPQWFSIKLVKKRLEISYLHHFHRGLKR
jgi:hypothetical protein